MNPQVQAAIIRAASDWAVFLSEKPSARTLFSKKSIEQLTDYFEAAYEIILQQAEKT